MLRVTNKRRNVLQSSSFGFVDKKGRQEDRQAVFENEVEV
jgi:hypothetical protein